MISIRLNKETEESISSIASKMKTTKSAFLRAAILGYLEDVEDYLHAVEVIEGMKELESKGEQSTYSLEEIKKKYIDEI